MFSINIGTSDLYMKYKYKGIYFYAAIPRKEHCVNSIHQLMQ